MPCDAGGTALALLGLAGDGAIQVYELGDWPAPFGIVLVADRLSVIMLVLTASLALIALPPCGSLPALIARAGISTRCSSSS